MAVDLRILNEQKLDVEGACERLGTSDSPAHPTTVYRAFFPGRLSVAGELVQLGRLKVSGTTMTSVEAIERYVARLNGIDLDAVEAPQASVPNKRRAKELADVDAALAAAGI